MRLKRFALKGLLLLAVAVAVCMYFARTVQTITTPKVRLVTPTTGRFEEKMSFDGEVFFPETEEIRLDGADKLNARVLKIRVKPGQYVHAGDTLFTCETPSLEEELAKLQLEYDTKNKELIDLDIANRRFSRESRQNELYEEMLSAQDTLSTCMAEARTIAIGEGVVLSGSVSGWQRQLNAIGDVPEKVNAAVQKAQAASEAYEEARAAFYAILENKKLRVSDDVFEYIRKRTGLIRELDTLTEKMVDLNVLAASLRTVTAPWDGYIAAVDIAEGDTLDGSKAVGSMTKEGTVPLLRAPLGETRRVFEPGTKVTVETAQGSEKTEVSETRVAADGTRYLWIALPERLLRPESSELRQMASDGRVSVSITYRAKNSTTLLVPSAVRNEGEGSDYVYLVEQNRGGFMSSAGLKVVKTKVTVIDRGDKYVSIADDLSYRQVADREDRALSDGMAVMEYVQ